LSFGFLALPGAVGAWESFCAICGKFLPLLLE